MGYRMHQVAAFFSIARDKQNAAFAAIKALAGKETIKDSTGPHFSWVDPENFAKCDSLHDMMEEWRWELEYDDDGNVDDIQFTGEKMGDDKILFDTIAPFVDPGSYIEMLGEDDARWRWVFNGSTCEEKAAETTYEDDKHVTEQEQRRFTKLMQEFLNDAQEITVVGVENAVEAAGSPHAYIVQLWGDFLAAKN